MRVFITTIALLLTVGFFSCDSGGSSESHTTTTAPAKAEALKGSNKGQAYIKDDGSKPNILQIALGSKDHTTLVAAVQAAGLENALVNAGPLTVFAPTNAAFAALPEGTLEMLLKPENKDKLSNILLYHVTPGNLKADFLHRLPKLGQANNGYVKIEKTGDGDKVTIGGANILGSVPAGNGIVHVIDKVLLPPAE